MHPFAMLTRVKQVGPAACMPVLEFITLKNCKAVLDTSGKSDAQVAARRLAANPIIAKPASIKTEVSGSGTA